MRGFGEIAERLRRSTVQVNLVQVDVAQVNLHQGGRRPVQRSGGSGIIWNADGLIVTNAHVVRGTNAHVARETNAHAARGTNAHAARAPEAEVELWDGRRFPARVMALDVRRDLATLRIAATGLEPATPGDSAALRPGELVIAVGNPLGFAGALSTGIVHSSSERWIHADLQLAPGNSGGPLANAHGQVVGVNTAIVNGLGAAVPSKVAVDFVERGARPSLGVVMRPVHLGLQLLEVEPRSAAANAGLRAGDVLLTRTEALNAALDSGGPTLRLHFLRDDHPPAREARVYEARVYEAVVRLGAPVEAAA